MMVYLFNGVLLSNKKGQTSDTGTDGWVAKAKEATHKIILLNSIIGNFRKHQLQWQKAYQWFLKVKKGVYIRVYKCKGP